MGTAAVTVLIAGTLAGIEAEKGSVERWASFLCGAIAAVIGVGIGSGMLWLMGRWRGILPRIISSAVSGVIAAWVGFFVSGLALLPMWTDIIGKRFSGNEAEALGNAVDVITTSALLCAVAGLLFGAGLGRSAGRLRKGY